MAVTDPCYAVLSPSIGLRARLIVREIVPCASVGAIVLPNGAPGAFAKIGTPPLPISLALVGLFESFFFFGHAILLFACWSKASDTADAAGFPDEASGVRDEV
jgi:hypothetical protein